MAIKRRGDSGSSAGASSDGNNGADVNIAWEDASTEFTRRNAVVHIYGDTGTGRTRLALTMPGPIGLAHAAEKIDGLIEQFSTHKQIRVVNFGGVFGGTPQQIADKAGPIWSKMTSAWFDAIDHWARTVIVDTDTEAWEILRLARFGELNPKGRIDNLYGPVNAEFRSLYKRARMQERCSVISIGQSKDEYRDVVRNGKTVGEKTGRTIRSGHKEVGFMSDVVLRTNRTRSGGFNAVVEKGWFSAESEGLVVEDDDCRLPYILSLITGTDESEWL